MKRILDSNIFYFILGAIIFSTISVYAVVLMDSEEITFTTKDSNWNVNNVQEALDDLYKKEPYDEYTETTTVTPNESTQKLLTKDKVLKDNIIINPIPETYKKLTTNTTVNETNMLKDITAYDKDGNLITGRLSSTECVFGSFVCDSNCTGSTGKVVVSEFSPSEFLIVIIDQWSTYYNNEIDPLNVYGYGPNNKSITKREIGNQYVLDNNMFIMRNFDSISNKTVYYMACK